LRTGLVSRRERFLHLLYRSANLLRRRRHIASEGVSPLGDEIEHSISRLPAYVKGFGCRPEAIDRPVQRPASESLRRTNLREAASGLPSMGILSGGGLGEE